MVVLMNGSKMQLQKLKKKHTVSVSILNCLFKHQLMAFIKLNNVIML